MVVFKLAALPKEIKWFITAFVIVLSIGFYTGLLFVNQTNSTNPEGIEINYLGNEGEPEGDTMIFRKSEREMLTITHTHILSMSFIFFLLGILVWMAEIPKKLKIFLTLEPFFSVLFTFGGIYLLWMGHLWMKYIVMVSGLLMTLTYIVASGIVLYQLLFVKHSIESIP